ncbi:MAG: UDP-N-acetylglucosamine 2-epimerase (non-hydrolyzing) [Flavobacteriales bacterium]|nr:UDP-N-acetylglucosamine 2-epimerase (non-hydrolyzing) [Flavobacteriales bacterium]
MKIITIVGARPQFIKAAALSREIATNKDIEEIIVHTGQHFDDNMSEVFFREMDIPLPKYNLAINSLNHGSMTGRMLEGIEKILIDEKPDLVLVYGDTNSTIAGALAAKKLHIKVAHVEAGLRSFNIEMPEEINRILTDRISDFLFCPTQTAVDNLKKEGYENIDCKIIRCGDVMQDAANYYSEKNSNNDFVRNNIGYSNFILCTLHRAENTDSPEKLSTIINTLNEIHEITPVVLPLHPRTKKKIADLHLELKVKIIEPVGYLNMIELLKKCSLVVTDSGGLQKEAFFFQKNCVTLRDQTEWVELIENNVNILSKINRNDIIDAINKMLTKTSDFTIDLYGNGMACKNILKELLKIKTEK